jgi:type I restriction enzyme S subunit
MVIEAKQLRTYNPSECIVFLKTNEKFGGLSNMAPGFPLCVNGVTFRTSEALYQACRFPLIPNLQHQIINERSPITAKMLIKPFKDKSRPDWLSVRIKVMRWCLRIKLAQNWHKFSNLLLSTGTKPIVELSSKDDFWGAKVTENGSLVGRNILGRLLMELRESIKTSGFEDCRTVKPISVAKFLLFQKPIAIIFGNSDASIGDSKEQRGISQKKEPFQLSLFKVQNAASKGK